jgi:RND superfamily putative drug exporter
VLAGWALVAVTVMAASATLGHRFDDSFAAPGSDSQRATDLLTRDGSHAAGLTARVAVTPDDATTFTTSPQARAHLAAVRSELTALPHVLGVGPPVMSRDGRVALVQMQYPPIDDLGPADLTRLKAAAADLERSTGLRVELGGDLFFVYEEADTSFGELAGLIAAALVLILAFGSIVAAGLPIATALVGLAVGASVLPLVAHLVDVPTWAPVIGTMVGLGVGIDYALFLLTRHREYLRAGRSVPDAVGGAVGTAGRSVVVAGGTVMVSILGLAVAGVPFMTAGGIAVSLMVLVMVVASVTLFPALLGLAGRRVLGKAARRADPSAAPTSGRGWLRWGEHVTRHARFYAAAGVLVLLALTAPVTSMRVGIPDEGTLPTTRTERRAYDLATEGFGPGVNGPLVVAVDLRHSADDAGTVRTLRSSLLADPGVAAVTPLPAGADLATLAVIPTTGPRDEATGMTLQRLRDDVLPAALAGTGAVAHVGGMTATFADVADRVQDRLPSFVLTVVLLSLPLLTVAFRSVLVPLKAALLNLLSIGAAYGVIVAVFQWGWGAGLIGLESTIPIVSFIPMFMFAILFGLSMDYEVFLLSRVREEYQERRDTVGSVVHGIATTGRVITSAAAVMVLVFLGFVTGADPSVKMFGLGLATAILVDATIVRLCIVPATMRLLGRANWWLPGWLARSLPVPAQPGRAAASTSP